MKKHYLGFATLILLNLVIIVGGCQKETGLPELQSKEVLKEESAFDEEETSGCLINLSDSEIALIGTEHNRLLQAGFNEYLYNNDIDLSTALNQVYEENEYPTLTEDEFAQIANMYSEDQAENTIQSTIDTMSNDIQRQIFTDMVSLVQNSSTYDELLEGLNILKDYTHENLTCFEKTSTLIALEVCINSAKLWIPVDAGGEGYYDFITNPEGGRIAGYQNRGFWRSLGIIICSDAIGAFGGFCRAALPYLASGGPANPVSNAALLGNAVIGGATSSATTAVGQAARR